MAAKNRAQVSPGFDARLEFDAERNRQDARGFAPTLANAG
jgi:hypothetical protein